MLTIEEATKILYDTFIQSVAPAKLTLPFEELPIHIKNAWITVLLSARSFELIEK